MTWHTTTLWFSRERYEIRMITPDLWIVFGPDGWVDSDITMAKVQNLADKHLKANPLAPT